MEKRILLFAIAITTVASVNAQFPVSDPHCAYCDVNLKTGEEHKPGCIYYSEQTNDESEDKNKTQEANKRTESTAVQTPKQSGTSSTAGKTASTYSYSSSRNISGADSNKPKPSTKLKDYVPAQERPAVSMPLMAAPLYQPAPKFSSINETNIRHEKPIKIVGTHEWGEIDESILWSFESDYNEEIPRECEIERYIHDKGTAILGTRKADGKYQWIILCIENGVYKLVPNKELKYNGLAPRDVHFEGQGKFIIAEYADGYRQVYNNEGEELRSGYNIRVLDGVVEGKHLIYVGKDENTVLPVIFNEDHEIITTTEIITQNNDALIVQGNDGYLYNLQNWNGDILKIDGISGFDDIKAFNNQGSYYILRSKEKGYSVVGKGFIRIGHWYATEEEAHQAWRRSR